MLMAESWQVGINIHLGAGIKPSSGLHNALLMGKCLMAVFVRVFAQKVTANICPIELLVRHFYLVYL